MLHSSSELFALKQADSYVLLIISKDIRNKCLNEKQDVNFNIQQKRNYFGMEILKSCFLVIHYASFFSALN